MLHIPEYLDILVCERTVVVSAVISQQDGSWFESQLGPFCVEFACSPRVCVASLWTLQLPPTA